MISFECSKINVIVLPHKKWSTLHRKFMLNANIQIALKKSSSVLSTLFHLIDLDDAIELVNQFGHLGN